MLSEAKIFLENLTHFRQLLNEAVGQGTIADAINKHKIVHIYYAGDDTVLKGYRTIYPLVLGQSKSKKAQAEGGYSLLRAWETAGNSDSRKIYYNQKGKPQYGWRLFRADKITSFLPTGENFSTDVKKFPDVEHYNPNDSQMTGIVAAVKVDSGEPETQVLGKTTAQKLPEPAQPSVFAGQKDKFQRFSNVAKKQREITADEVSHLWGMVNQMRSRGSREKYWVVNNEHGDMVLKTENQLKDIDPDAIIGNLKDLYVKLVKPNEKINTTFLDKAKNDALKEANKMNQPNITQENTVNKTFFK
jgi:hypothetical protein